MTPTTCADMTLVWAAFGPAELVGKARCIEYLPACDLCAPVHVYGHLPGRRARARYQTTDPGGNEVYACTACWLDFCQGALGPGNQLLFQRHENIAILVRTP